MKTCTECGKEKEESEFYTGRRKCKVCVIENVCKYQKNCKYWESERGRAVKRKAQRKHSKTPIKKIKTKLLGRLRRFIGGNDSKLNRETMGCTLAFFRARYESLFKPGMTWENYGEWENDHIKEMCKFDLLNEETWKECMHYSNLQPQWRDLNCKNIH